jgi:hypothetical protein
MYGDTDRAGPHAQADDHHESSEEGEENDDAAADAAQEADQASKAAAGQRGAGRGASKSQQRHPQLEEGVLLEAAARFCQATAELQFLGVWRPVKRQRTAAAALNVTSSALL